MMQAHPSEEFELLRRGSSDSVPRSDSPGEREYADDLGRKSNLRRFWHSWRFWIGVSLLLSHQVFSKLRHSRHSVKPRKARLCRVLAAFLGFLISFCVIFTVVFRPSYNSLPQHYKLLERKCRESQDFGRGNVNNEKVFIAATLHDRNGLLVGGEWGNAVAELVQLLGPDNVHVSVYENDPDLQAQDALDKLGTRLQCNKSLIFEHLPLEELPHILLPSGGSRIRRIAFLAEVRNRALRSLRDSPVQFDKLLYLNDVMFNPIDAVQLLFSTNIDAHGRTQYGAACAVDFINAFKFYDRFATRDLEGL